MHLLIPFASALFAEALQVLPTLALPNLAHLLGRLDAVSHLAGDEYALTPPHERALAEAWGWHGGDGLLPFAAHAAAADGIDTGDAAWGLLTPAHWHVGREHITMAPPEALALDAEASRAVFELVRELFESEGYRCAWGAPERWYAAHERLADLPCASLDRVIGRNVDHWLGSADPRLAPVRRLQSEVQLLLYPHAVNAERERQGALPVNSFWLSGCGRRQPVAAAGVVVEAALRQPAVEGDAAGWVAAWTALDAGPLAALRQQADDPAAHEPVVLTLCGERHAQRFAQAPRSLWQRLQARRRRPDVAATLAAL